jgi:hypothetical protein
MGAESDNSCEPASAQSGGSARRGDFTGDKATRLDTADFLISIAEQTEQVTAHRFSSCPSDMRSTKMLKLFFSALSI